MRDPADALIKHLCLEGFDIQSHVSRIARGGFEQTAEFSRPVSALRVSRGVSVMSPPGCT